MQLKIIIRQVVPQNPFATPVRVNSVAQRDNMSSQILVNTDFGNGTKLLLKPVFTESYMRFSGSFLHHFDLPNISSVPTSLVHVVSSRFLLYPWYSCCHLHPGIFMCSWNGKVISFITTFKICATVMLFKMPDRIKYVYIYITILYLYVYNHGNVYIVIGIKIYIMYFTTSGYNAI